VNSVVIAQTDTVDLGLCETCVYMLCVFVMSISVCVSLSVREDISGIKGFLHMLRNTLADSLLQNCAIIFNRMY